MGYDWGRLAIDDSTAIDELDQHSRSGERALEAKAARYYAERALEQEWTANSCAGRWFGDLPDDGFASGD